jgi:hypothetical protein
MSSIAYDAQRCSLYKPANIHELADTDRQNKDFFSDVILNAIESESDMCVELSRLAYFKFEDGEDKRKELITILAKAKLEYVFSFSKDSTQGFVAKDSNKIFLVFRGAEAANLDETTLKFSVESLLHRSLKSILQLLLRSIWRLRHLVFFKFYAFLKHRKSVKKLNIIQAVRDFVTDAFFIKENAGKFDRNLRGYVHKGFLRAFVESKSEWEDAVRAALKDNDRTIVICGHSLGAALASLSAACLVGDFCSRIRLHTFGCPRVGDENFVASMAGVFHRRYVDCRDMVTHIPPAFFCYTHHGEQIYIDASGRKITENPDPDTAMADMKHAFWSYFLIYKKLPFQNDNVWFRGLADHAPINYVSGVLGLRY